MRRFILLLLAWLIVLALLWRADTAQMAGVAPLRATLTPLVYVTPLPTRTPESAYPPPAYPAPAHRHAPETLRDAWEDIVGSR
jgi:hypothetical protein